MSNIDPFDPTTVVGAPHVQLEAAPRTIPDLEKGDLLHRFRAYVKNTTIANNGEVLCTIGVHPEDKWMALPLTDIMAMIFVVEIYDPRPALVSNTPHLDHLARALRGDDPPADDENVIDLTSYTEKPVTPWVLQMDRSPETFDPKDL